MPKRSRRIREADLKQLWCMSGGICAICRRGLARQGERGVIGEMAHIVAHGEYGPRSDSEVPPETVNAYENLVLLCPTHHAVVDREPENWPAERLRSVKRETEAWVARRLQSPCNAGEKCLFVISGPSGVGKDVIIGRLIHALPRLGIPAVNLRRFTTRDRRPDETYETPFTYLSEAEFDAKVKLGEIGCVHCSLDNYYGCDPRFSPAAKPGTAIFYSMRVYDYLPSLRHNAEEVGVHVRNILLTADQKSVRSRVLMRSALADEKVRRIDQALEDLDYLEEHSEFVATFFDLVVRNADGDHLAGVMSRLESFVISTMNQISEIGTYWNGRTIESRSTLG